MDIGITKVLDICGVDYEVLKLEEGIFIVVSRYGGHIFGPFSETFPEGIFWMPEDALDAAAFEKKRKARDWNTGGDRVWIAPEIQFNIIDRVRHQETLKTPASIDPGNFWLERAGEKIRLGQELTLVSRNTISGKIELTLSCEVYRALNPLRKLDRFSEWMEGITYCGYELSLALSGRSREAVLAEAWNLLQIRPGGLLYIPMYAPQLGTDYYAPAGELQYLDGDGVCLVITGKNKFKTAYKSAFLTGRFGYFLPLKGEEACLILLNYPNNPSALYSEEPPEVPGDTGYSIHIYSDDGGLGGFAEMECNLQTIGGPGGQDRAFDRVTKWIFTGPRQRLGKIAELLLGKDIPASLGLHQKQEGK